MKKQKNGFTLIEFMIVVAIIALLAAIAVPSFIRVRSKNLCFSNLRRIDKVKRQYTKDNSNAVPTNLSQLMGKGEYLRDTPACKGGGTYTLNALGVKPSCSVHGTAP